MVLFAGCMLYAAGGVACGILFDLQIVVQTAAICKIIQMYLPVAAVRLVTADDLSPSNHHDC